MSNFKKRALVALSGGADSMLLLTVMAHFKKKGWITDLAALHVDHGTWGGKKLKDILHEACTSHGVKLTVRYRPLSLDVSNFEMKARLLRLKALTPPPDTTVVTGHHLDDSLEWSLMQQMRGQSLRGTLGIPLRQGPVLRPFLCLTRAQIEAACAHNRIDYLNDPSNENLRFERNRLRHGPLKELKQMYPKLLKHHAHIQNELALTLGVHALSGPSQKFQHISVEKIPEGLILTDHSGRYFLEGLALVTRALEHLSPAGRGSLRNEVAKIPRAMERGRRGPMSLSGGIQAFLGPNRLVLKKK